MCGCVKISNISKICSFCAFSPSPALAATEANLGACQNLSELRLGETNSSMWKISHLDMEHGPFMDGFTLRYSILTDLVIKWNHVKLITVNSNKKNIHTSSPFPDGWIL